jgi:hypothetical protein
MGWFLQLSIVANVTSPYRQMAAHVSEPRPYETNWVITEQPRCCSDCTYVAAGFKCKVKSCLHNCPWARSAGNYLTDFCICLEFEAEILYCDLKKIRLIVLQFV